MSMIRARARGGGLPGQERIDAEILLVEDDRALALMDGISCMAAIRRKLAKDRLAVIGEDATVSAQFLKQGGILHDEARKAGRTPVVAMLDIDFFKKINDTYSHDAVLRHFAALLDEHFGGDLVGRLGGEEFALIVTDGERAGACCEAFRRAVEQAPATFGETHIPLTVSIGITRDLQANLEATLRVADANLYQAKQTGRNRVVAI